MAKKTNDTEKGLNVETHSTIKGTAKVEKDYSFELAGKKYVVPEAQREFLTVGKEYGIVVHQLGIDFYLI